MMTQLHDDSDIIRLSSGYSFNVDDDNYIHDTDSSKYVFNEYVFPTYDIV